MIRTPRGYPVDDPPREIERLRAELSSVTGYLESLLAAGKFPASGRSRDDQSAAMEWWDERVGACESARAAIDGTSVEEWRAKRDNDAGRAALEQGGQS